MRIKFSIILLLITSVVGCSVSRDIEGLPEMDQKTRIKFNQYYRDGRLLYINYCSSCHMEDGNGLKNLIPSLEKSSLFSNSINDVPCQIKYESLEHAKAPSGPQMKGFISLSDLEIAELATYISSSWGNKNGLLPVKEVSVLLDSCRN